MQASSHTKRSPAESTARVSCPFEMVDAADSLLGKGALILLARTALPRLVTLAETTALSV
jgi:hypothetical protein